MSNDNAPVSVVQRFTGSKRHIKYGKPKLPIVQVNPFLRERDLTWYKDKSLPEYYEKHDVVQANTEAHVKPSPTTYGTHSDSLLTSRERRSILPLSQLNKANNEATDVESPSPAHPHRVKLFDSPPPPVDVCRGRRIVFPPTPRGECISPEQPIKKLPKHGFAPSICDREKKTVVESPKVKPTSLLNRERTSEFVNKQQVLKLRGLRLSDGHSLTAPAPSTYLDRHQSMPLKSLEDFYRHLVSSYSRGYAFSPTKSRMTAVSCPTSLEQWTKKSVAPEPLVSLNHEDLNLRLNSSMELSEAKSAFRILESAGKPTCLEQNLQRDFNQYYDRSKYSRLGSMATSGHHFTRFQKLKNYNLTQGELYIMVSKEQNRSGTWSLQHSKKEDGKRLEGKISTESWLMKADEQDFPVSPDIATNMVLAEEGTEQLCDSKSESSLKQHAVDINAMDSDQDKKEVIVKLDSHYQDMNNESLEKDDITEDVDQTYNLECSD